MNISDYRDDHGLITQTDHDPGDCSNREGIYYTLLALNNTLTDDLGRTRLDGFRADLAKLTASAGTFWRTPRTGWYNNPRCFSRDQHAALILAAATLKDTASLWQLVRNFPKRLFFHQNNQTMGTDSPSCFPDIMSPGELVTIIRGFNLWVLYPVLVVVDLFLCLDVLLRKKGLWDYDNLVAARLMHDLEVLPTPGTVLNAYFYHKTDYRARILNYYSFDNNGIPPLGDLYVNTCNKLLGDA